MESVLYGNDLYQFYFWISHFVLSIKDFSLQSLLWSPWNFLGHPYLFNLQFGALNPLIIFSPILGVTWYVNFIYVFSITLSFFGQFFLLKNRIKLSFWASIVGGLIWSFNGFVFPRIYAGHLNLIQTYAWLPVIIYSLDYFLETKKTRWFSCWILLNYLQLTSGFISLFVFSLIIQFFWTVINLRLLTKKIIKIQNILVGILSLIVIIPIYFNFKEIIFESQRSVKSDFTFSSSYSLPIENLVTFLSPDQYGNPLYLGTEFNKYRYLGKFNYWELSGFFGISGLYLSVLGLFYKKKYSVSFAILAVFSLLMALGDQTPLFGFVFSHLGFYKYIRIPAQHLYVFLFSASILASMGAEKIILGRKNYKITHIALMAIFSMISILNIIYIPIWAK